MDMRHATEVARNVAIWILNLLGAVLLLWVTDTYGNVGLASPDRRPVAYTESCAAHSIDFPGPARAVESCTAADCVGAKNRVDRAGEFRGQWNGVRPRESHSRN